MPEKPPCPLCDPQRRAAATALCLDLQTLLDGFFEGTISSTGPAAAYLLGLHSGLLMAFSKSPGETQEEADLNALVLVQRMKSLQLLARKVRSGDAGAVRIDFAIPAAQDTPDLTIPEELKWKPQ